MWLWIIGGTLGVIALTGVGLLWAVYTVAVEEPKLKQSIREARARSPH